MFDTALGAENYSKSSELLIDYKMINLFKLMLWIDYFYWIAMYEMYITQWISM